MQVLLTQNGVQSGMSIGTYGASFISLPIIQMEMKKKCCKKYKKGKRCKKCPNR